MPEWRPLVCYWMNLIEWRSKFASDQSWSTAGEWQCHESSAKVVATFATTAVAAICISFFVALRSLSLLCLRWMMALKMDTETHFCMHMRHGECEWMNDRDTHNDRRRGLTMAAGKKWKFFCRSANEHNTRDAHDRGWQGEHSPA